jgi:hypothetical protein
LQEIDHLQDNKCPYCKQQFEESKGKVQECLHSISDFDDKIASLQEAAIATAKELDAIEEYVIQHKNENLVIPQEYYK